jgi:putative flippase GtrA
MRIGWGNGLLRYAGVGLGATASHYALMAALVEWGLCPAWVASGLGAVLGAQVAFFGNRHFTFAHDGPGAAAWWKFQGTAAVGALLGMGIVAAGVWMGLHYLLAQVVATGCALLLTYAINRRWTFSRPSPGAPLPRPDPP